MINLRRTKTKGSALFGPCLCKMGADFFIFMFLSQGTVPCYLQHLGTSNLSFCMLFAPLWKPQPIISHVICTMWGLQPIILHAICTLVDLLHAICTLLEPQPVRLHATCNILGPQRFVQGLFRVDFGVVQDLFRVCLGLTSGWYRIYFGSTQGSLKVY